MRKSLGTVAGPNPVTIWRELTGVRIQCNGMHNLVIIVDFRCPGVVLAREKDKHRKYAVGYLHF